MAVIAVSMPDSVSNRVRAEAKALGLSASDFVRRSIDHYTQHQRESQARIAALEAQAQAPAQKGGAQ